MGSGVKDVDDFFGQICSLSNGPIEVLEQAGKAGGNFTAISQELKNKGYPIWALDSQDDQVELSACAGNDGRWVLADVSGFSSKCGGSSPLTSPGPSNGGSCVPAKK